jgi:hypothetical protein
MASDITRKIIIDALANPSVERTKEEVESLNEALNETEESSESFTSAFEDFSDTLTAGLAIIGSVIAAFESWNRLVLRNVAGLRRLDSNAKRASVSIDEFNKALGTEESGLLSTGELLDEFLNRWRRIFVEITQGIEETRSLDVYRELIEATQRGLFDLAQGASKVNFELSEQRRLIDQTNREYTQFEDIDPAKSFEALAVQQEAINEFNKVGSAQLESQIRLLESQLELYGKLGLEGTTEFKAIEDQLFQTKAEYADFLGTVESFQDTLFSQLNTLRNTAGEFERIFRQANQLLPGGIDADATGSENAQKQIENLGKIEKARKEEQRTREAAAKRRAQLEAEAFDRTVQFAQAGIQIAEAFSEKERGFAVIQAVISAAAGIVRQFRDFPFPVAIANSAVIAATAATQIAAIQSASATTTEIGYGQSVTSFAQSGFPTQGLRPNSEVRGSAQSVLGSNKPPPPAAVLVTEDLATVTSRVVVTEQRASL